MDLAARVHEQGEPNGLPGVDAQHAGGVDVGMIDRYRRGGRGGVVGENALQAATWQRLGGDDPVDKMEVRVVVVDEVAEQTVVGTGDLAETHLQVECGQCRVRRLPPGAQRVGGIRCGISTIIHVGVDVKRQPRGHDGDRAPDEPGDVLLAEAAERVDVPQRRVDGAQHCR